MAYYGSGLLYISYISHICIVTHSEDKNNTNCTCLLEYMQLTTEAKVLLLDNFGEQNIIAATESNEITSTADSTHILHTKNDATVTEIISVGQDITLIFSERNDGRGSATAYKGPHLQQIPGLTLHDVYGGAIVNRRHQSVAVFTQAAIRVLEFNIHSEPKALIRKTIELKGVKVCCRDTIGSRTLLIATETEYKLVDLVTGSQAPLFPITNGLIPMMSRMGSDFLVVQGTSPEEYAMGLFVDAEGEVSRQGVIVQWQLYPTSLATTSDHIFSISGGKLKIYTVEGATITEEPENKFTTSTKKIVKVFKLSYSVKAISNELVKRLGNVLISKVNSEIAFLFDDNTIELWQPTPKLVHIENQIMNGDLNTVVPDINMNTGEQGVAELEYLSVYLILNLLDNGKYSEALREWRNGAQIDINLVLYIYCIEKHLPEGVYPGLKPLINSLRKKAEEDFLEPIFLIHTLRTAVKRLRRGAQSSLSKTKYLEILLAKEIFRNEQARPEFIRFLLEKDLKARNEIIDWLYSLKRYDTLERYYSLAGKNGQLAKLRLEMLRDSEIEEDTIHRVAAELLQMVTSIDDVEANEFDLWDVAMELIGNNKVNVEIGLEVLKMPRFENRYNPSEVLEYLKNQIDSGEPWKAYLKYLVYSKGLFQDDFATLVVTDIISVSQTATINDAIKLSYDTYCSVAWPKSSYQDWLSLSIEKDNRLDYPKRLLVLQLELWNLMKGDLDWIQLMSTFEMHLSAFMVERAVIYQKLGLHEQSLQMLFAIGDFRSIIDYSVGAQDRGIRGELTHLTLRILLRFKGSGLDLSIRQNIEILREFLQVGVDFIEIHNVMNHIDPTTAFHVIADFVTIKISNARKDEYQSQTLHSITKAASNLTLI